MWGIRSGTPAKRVGRLHTWPRLGLRSPRRPAGALGYGPRNIVLSAGPDRDGLRALGALVSVPHNKVTAGRGPAGGPRERPRQIGQDRRQRRPETPEQRQSLPPPGLIREFGRELWPADGLVEVAYPGPLIRVSLLPRKFPVPLQIIPCSALDHSLLSVINSLFHRVGKYPLNY